MPSMGLLALLAFGAVAFAGCAQPPAESVDGDGNGGAGSLADGAAGEGGSGAGAGSGGGGSPPAGGPGGPPSGGQGGPGGTGSQTTGGTSSGGTSTGVGWDVPQSVHQAAWLCQTATSVNDITPRGTDGQQCYVQLSFSSTTLTVTATGIPNHDFESGSGCCATTQSVSKTFPLSPTLATTPTYPSQRGSIATAVNGVALFGPEDSNGADVVIATYTTDDEPRLATCDAHSEPQSGTYHYHADGNCIHYRGSMSDYGFSKVDSTAHSKIIAWAPDGFPIYGSYGYGADNATVKKMVSSYRFKSGADGSNGQDDQEYVAGLGDLDECNGKIGPTPEFPNGIYHYFSTKSGGGGGFGFPYFPLCYRGVVNSGSGGMTGGGTGGAGGTGGTGGTGGPMSTGSQTASGGTCPPPQQGQPPPPGCGPPPGGGGPPP